MVVVNYVLASALAVTTFHGFILGVAGHGYVQNVNTNGQDYTGWLPFSDPYADPVPARVIRKIPSDGPSECFEAHLACNTGGETGASVSASVPAGSSVTFDWTNWPADHLGPVSSYMASCNGDCANFNVKGAQWFKIDASGYDQSTSTWASAELIANNNSWTSTVPKQLASGHYLIRHEIVALHSTGQPQYYPSCLQVNVTGGGSSTPSGDDLVSIPGLYDNVAWPDIWTDFGSFTIPGPAIVFTDSTGSTPSGVASASASGSQTAAPSKTAAASTTPEKSATPTRAATSSPLVSTGRCKAKKSRASAFKRHASIRRSH
ncbi:hypothetical protein PUNSTDRAFT_154790 [Punctularia strigosozonata HHB-11173 SS5]|uniref:uncharacterized protein n=1 Tax=Punctularia strigosozonata (strain HHB-11173) TaxID=741275 RepID=UPI000441807B|nr:uncharacterized protein PUNSTDRAFT_154790 [Punctularia strigosozonata HHB-11173 SS5]EIN12107.1 hypothetical protein PUNSTDRAFT_154790 [Punctularia strigosozonata HHB-11173 SS5]